MGVFKKGRRKIGEGIRNLAERADEVSDKAQDIAEKNAAEARKKAADARAKLEREAREAAETTARLARENAARIEREAREKAVEARRKAAEVKAKLEREAREAARAAEQRKNEEAARLKAAAEQLRAAANNAAQQAASDAAAGLVVLSDAAKSSLRRLDIQTWPTNVDRFEFPEAGDPQLMRRDDLGIAISGGGTRSMSLSLGYLRAFRKQGVLDRTRYIGAISGGSWIAVPYTYLPENISDDEFFGHDTPAELLTPENLARITPRDGVLAKQISQAELLSPILGSILANGLAQNLNIPIPFAKVRIGLDDIDEEWGRALGKVFLNRLGIAGDRYACWREEDAKRIIDRNRNLLGRDKLELGDFVLQTRDRPYLCVNGAMNQEAYLIPDEPDEKWRPLGWRSWEHVEYTPKYSGIHRSSRGAAKMHIGGGYMENVGIDTILPKAKGSFVNVSCGLDHHRFSPQDMMAISGAAPAYIMHGLGPILRSSRHPAPQLLGYLSKIMPKLRDWPVQFDGKPVVRERAFGDGGYVDNYGIIPLLKRKVKKIIVLINTSEKLGDHETEVLGSDPVCDTFLHTLFGINTGRSPSVGSPSDFLQPGRFLGRENGQVFDSAGLRPMLKGMIEKIRAGKPAYHCSELTTLRNDFFGIEAGHTCDILWIYNHMYDCWYKKLPEQTQALFKGGVAERRGLAGFPRIGTFNNGSDSETAGLDLGLVEAAREGGARGVVDAIDRVVDLDSFQVKLAASHAYHVAHDIREEVARFLAKGCKTPV